MTETTIRCASCGWKVTTTERHAVAAHIRAHMPNCTSRFYDEPLFGYEARWKPAENERSDGRLTKETIEVAWTFPSWGAPLNL